MSSNRSLKQTPRVKMKQQQSSKKKTTVKTSPKDSISETISFVIKGKLTPIKPNVVAKKIKDGKKILDEDVRKKTTNARMDKDKTTNIKSSIKSKVRPLQKIKGMKKVPKPENVKATVKRVTKPKVPNKNNKTSVKSNSKNDNEEMKKKRTIAKILKQVNQVLERKSTKKVKTTKPKNVKQEIVKKENKVNISRKVKDSGKEVKIEKCEKKHNLKDDCSSSDDNNLEEIRQALKSNKPAKKSNIKKNCDKTTPKNKILKKNSKKTKVISKKKKTPSLEDIKMRKMRLFGFWNGPKKQRVASLNALAKVHCLYENEGKINSLDNPESISIKKELIDESQTEKTEMSPLPQRNLRRAPGLRGVGKHWDMHNASSSSSDENSEDNEIVFKKVIRVKKEPKKYDDERSQKKRKRKQTEIVMDLKDMVVRKRMASLNATAILAASYSQEKRHPKSPKSEATDNTDTSEDDFTEDDGSEKKKCYADDVKEEADNLIEVCAKPNKKVAVILNQDTDVTITGVYVNSTTRSTHHEGYCSIAGMQYRISATSHTQTAATAVATETLLQSSNSNNTQENATTDTPTPTKSYKPLDALSNMRPPSDGAHQSMGPPQHLMGIPSSGVRHSCTSAFSTPHVSSYHHASGPVHSGPPAPSSDSGYIHGYYQPAGPLITLPLGHGQPPLTKSAPLSEISPTPSPLSSHPPHPAPSSNGDSSDSEVIITSVTAGKDVPPPQQAHSSFRYSQYHPNLPPQNYSYPYSPYYHSTPPPTSYPTHDMCYPSSPYIHHKFPSTTYRRYVGGPQYYPSNPTTQDIYAIPPSHGQASQQVVTTTPASGTGNYQPPLGPQPPTTLMEPYPPTIVEAYPTHYYPGYHPPGPPSACYSHAPPTRAVPFLNGVYQNCPCPMQSCPKNGLTGPLTGESKRSSTLPKGSVQPLPPVALALPKEPTSDGPPSPARGSAGMPPPPSPAGATYQQPTPPATKQENEIPITENKRKARVGKAMVRSNMQNTMLLMCNPIPVNCVKREIESPKEKEANIVPEKEDNALNETKVNILQQSDTLVSPFESIQKDELPSSVKTEESIIKPTEILEENHKLEPVISTVGENVKMKNMKRKLSSSTERKEEIPVKKQKTETKSGNNSSYKNLIKKNTSSITINNGKRKLIQQSKIPQKFNLISRKQIQQKKRQLNNNSKEQIKNKIKQQLIEEVINNNNNIKQKCNNIENECEDNENTKKGNFTSQSAKTNQKIAVKNVDKILNKNNSIDRTIDCVINDALRTKSVKTDKVKSANKLLVPNVISAKKSTKTCKKITNRKKSKCKETQEELESVRMKPMLKWSNGWNWEGESYDAKVFLNSDETTVIRKCYPSMRHHSGDLIEVKDCVLLKAGARRNELPFVAKIAALWENPEDGEMMMSLLWYYRPEHTDQGRQPTDQPDEVFASRHKDSNSVACIDDKCYVLTFNEYCRYRKILRRQEEGIDDENEPSIPVPEPYPRSHRQPPPEMKISPEMIFFCRRVYDFRQKRIIKNPT